MSPSGAERLSLWVVFLIILAFYGDATTDAELCAGRCGIHNISHPFRLQNSSDKCGDTRYNLSCENNQLMLYLGHGKYQVKSINYDNYTIRIVDDVNFEQHQHDYSYNFSNDAAPYQVYQEQDVHILVLRFRYRKRLAKQVLYLRCPNGNGVNSYAMSCMNKSNITSFYVIVNGGITSMSFRDAMVYNDGMSLWDLALGDSCRVEWTYLTSWPFNETSHHNNFSCRHIRDILLYGFELSWSKAICQDFGVAHVNNKSRCELPGAEPFKFLNTIMKIFLIIILVALLCCARFVFGATSIIVLLLCKWRRRHLSMYDAIENFLRSDNNIMPVRYSYKDIKRITEKFKTKLGNGGYGSVFKGKLRSGRIVAVKILDKAKANGQEFISEVVTIGRIHHVHVVQLIGFCSEGSKRALIYEFMPNGSLEKYIFSNEENSSLSCENLYTIALGVARGIEYLHNGCNMKILHFDIKPHNILLDENFNPKVSDFGLARLCPMDTSIVSLTAARGTIGYMAPELFYRNVGRVSHKADVYSFGMLLMEMAGRRRNLNALLEESSQIYFPFWVYNQLHDGREIRMENDTDEEINLTKKMMIVALWCIQTRPSDRPPMDRVLEMLEKDEELQLPSKPYFFPQDQSIQDVRDHISSRSSSSISLNGSKKSL